MKAQHRVDPPPADPLSPGRTVAGYRIVRRLAGDGDAAWLVHAADGPACVLTAAADGEAARRRILMSERVRSAHVLALLDVATDGVGRILFVSERTDWSLASLLACRSRLAAGEAVTVLAPLAAGLAAVRAAGFVHTGLTAATVFFAADGRPVIGGLDHLESVAVPSAGTAVGRHPGFSANQDLVALAGLVQLLGRMVDDPARTELAAVADWLETASDDGEDIAALCAQVECRIFAVAPALPVVLVAEPPIAAPVPVADGGAIRPAQRTELRGVAGAVLERMLERARLLGLGGWLRRVLRGRSLAVCLAIVLAGLTVVGGLALIPPDRSRAGPASAPSTSPPGTVASPSESSPATEVPIPGELTAQERTTLTGDDPVAAGTALLAVRARCARHGQPCGTQYAEPGSAIDESDRSLVAANKAGRMLLVASESRTGLTVVQQYGDAVLLQAAPGNTKRQPVLVLAVRTDTGWRLRNLFEPD